MRSDRLLQELGARGVGAALINRRKNMFYLSGYTGEGCLLATPEGMTIFTDFRYTEQAGRQAPKCKCVRTGGEKSVNQQILDALGDIKTLAVEDDFITHKEYVQLAEDLSGVTLSGMDGIIERMRQIKDKDELIAIRKASRIACKAFDELLKIIRPDMTEKELAIELDYLMLMNGAEKPGFETIACAGANGSLPHGIPSEHRIKTGELITFDFGAMVGGYTCDMTRTLAIGQISPKLRDLYNTVYDAQLMSLEAVKPGADCVAVDKVARDFIDKKYPGAFGHGLGHSLGLDIHEEPRFSPKAHGTLVPGMVMTVEPGVYVPGLGGCRIEDTVIVTDTGCEITISTNKKLITI